MSPLSLINTAASFQAGSIAKHVDQWFKVSKDPWILSVVQGVELQFETEQVQARVPFPYRLSHLEHEAMDQEIGKLLGKGQ